MQETLWTVSYNTGSECHSKHCSCCLECVDYLCSTHKDGGICISDPQFCLSGYYMEDDDCLGADCTCCRPCAVSQECLEHNGYPERASLPCKEGFEATEGASPECVCCKPVAETRMESTCRVSGVVVGMPSNSSDFCTEGSCPDNYYQFNTGCESTEGNCHYCKPGGWSSAVWRRVAGQSVATVP